ncbi:MAG: nucleotide sugar dehydrogenase [Clostridiales bacterium]|jgi:UDP-N-acetyl-D-mannosaminuronic acid dehydrogenase|nr:nucleotide sugar dehydrogenase [Clostridiales bacterium]
MYEVCVVGLGYIGLPTALMLAAHGNRVAGVDYDTHLIETLRSGKVTFQEDGLEALFAQALSGDIQFFTEYQKANYYIVAVPTPFDKDTKKIDPSYVINAVGSVLDVCPKSAVIIIESTISPGTINKFVRPFIQSRGFSVGDDIHLVHAPERIIPGAMIRELKQNSRIIGSDSKETGEVVRKIYATFCEGEIILTDIHSAEMSKVVENTFRDVNIAFANELAKICRQDNLDVYEIIRIANMHPRVNILSPGPGVGGHCISVDPWFLVGDYPGLSLLIHEARKINDSMPAFVLQRVHEIMKENNLTDISRVGFYGITYKEDVDDIRESPTLQLFEIMQKHLGGGVKFYDPLCKPDILPGQVADFDTFLDSCDIIVIMVGHKQILNNMPRLEGKWILDTRDVCKMPGVFKL